MHKSIRFRKQITLINNSGNITSYYNGRALQKIYN